MDELDLTFVQREVERIGGGSEKVLEILQAVQGHYGYLPREALERVCKISEIRPASIVGISSFYDQFRHRPCGRHIIRVCVGTACHVKGAELVYDAFLRHLKIAEGEDTDAEKLFTIERVACLGCCTLAPAVQIGGVTYGHLTSDTVGMVVDDFLRHQSLVKAGRKRDKGKEDKIGPSGEIRIGLGSCCVARGSGKLHEALAQALDETGIRVEVKRVGCVGMCYQTPLLEVVPPGGESHLYARVEPEDAKAIVLKHFKVQGAGRKIRNTVSHALDNLLSNERHRPVARYSINVREDAVADFLGKQKHIATEHCGYIDPIDFDEYLRNDGFKVLRRCIDEVGAE